MFIGIPLQMEKVYIGITCKPRPQDRWKKGEWL